MPKFIEQLAQQGATSLLHAGIGGIVGMGLQRHNDKRQREQHGEILRMNMEGEKEMTEYNMRKQLEMWEKTGYGAQMEQLKKAGLNPGLLYGMGGAGGQTTDVATGHAGATGAPAGGREIQDMMGISMQAAQLSLLKAQKENIEADTSNKEADTANKPLVGANIKQDTLLKESETALKDIEGHIQGRSQNMQIAMIETELRELTERLQIQANQRKISDATVQEEIKKVKFEAVGLFLKNLQTNAETKAIGVELAQKWEALRIQSKQLTYQEWGAAIQQQLADYQTSHPDIGKVTGNLLDSILKLINAK